MFLESITDQQFPDLGLKRQVEILNEHCAGVEERIRTAQSQRDAENIAEETCGRLQEVCLSSMVQRALVRKTREFIVTNWGAARKN